MTNSEKQDILSTYGTWFHQQSAVMLNWMTKHVLVWGTLAQFGSIILLLITAHFSAKHSAAWLEKKLQNRDRKGIIWIHASYQEIFFLLFTAIFLWFAELLAQGAELPFQLLRTAASLATAWAIIRFTSSAIGSPFWSRAIAITLWVLAALNIVGWLGTAMEMMDNSAVTIGNVRLSLLLVLKSLLAFAALFWAVGFFSAVLDRSFKKAKGITPSQRVLFYKISNIFLYTVGGLIGLNIVGLDLTALTVFSGALGLGVGFGLQKVFANLISGIILLLDKSVKPGDVISINGTFGWVNSLGARCVSVLTRDGKEYLIPNENLITQEVENWSYSDQKVRFHIPIGVAYNSNIHEVKEVLLQAVNDHHRVLKIPTPVCLIKGFGDSSIDFEIRAWINDPAEGISNIKSEIYFRAWDLFKEHGIEIPFPQRDINFRPEFLKNLAQLIHTANIQANHENQEN